MSDTQDKLRALLATRGLTRGAEWKVGATARAQERASGAHEIAHVLPGEVVGDEEAGFYRVREMFPLEAVHGNATLGNVLHAAGEMIALAANDDALLAFNPRTTIFIDTETTGLSGGTGTVCFLVGIGYFTDDGFCLDQCFLRDYDDEEAMVAYLAERFAEATCLVSYNGKSFDLPLLRTRFIQNRAPFRLDGFLHYDLVHAARRMWRRRLGDCSLQNVERVVLGIERQGDVPSYLIPQIWLDYLRSRDARRLKPVFYHHKTDILSLVSLTAHLAQAMSVPEGRGFEHAEDRVSLLRLHYAQKRYDQVLALAEQVLEELDDATHRGPCLEMLAFAAKRRAQWEVMERAWQRVCTEFPRHLSARLELAKYYEHRAGDLARAETICLEAISLYENTRVVYETELRAEAFSHRLDRIRRKMARANRLEF